MKSKDYRDFLSQSCEENDCMENARFGSIPSVPRPRQNMIWIVSDQQRAQSIAANGDPNVRTPNLDVMSRMGVNFNRAVSGFPICCPFRGTMLTGIYHHKCVPGHEYQLPTDQVTVTDVFNENGYDTAYFGKWHLDGCRRNPMLHVVPRERRGRFATWIGYENNNSQWNTWVHGHTKDGEIEQYQLKGYETDALTDLLISYLKEKSEEKEDQPFFAVLSVQPPHEPYIAPPECLEHYQWDNIKLRPNVPQNEKLRQEAKIQLARYYAMVENLDRNVGRVLKALREYDLDLNTQIMFFSDHGDMMGSHGLYGKVVPYEESIRIPMIISGGVPQYNGYVTGVSDAVFNDVDIAPTTLGLCGLPIPESMEGYDYSHYRYYEGAGFQLKAKDDEPQSAYIQVTMPREGCDKAWRAVVTRDNWKYVCFEGEEWMLFNLNEDPYEQNNLAHSFPHKEKRKELHKLLEDWIKKTGDHFKLPDREYI